MVEIDVLPASNDTRGADSILIRFEPHSPLGFSEKQIVVLIDGGYADNCERITSHLKSHYNTNTINCVVCTHPDADHINGLIKLVESDEVTIHNLCIHDPWKHAYAVSRKVTDGRSTTNSVKSRLDGSLSLLDDLLCAAEKTKKPIKVHNTFAGDTLYDAITVLGPTKDYYCELVKQFPGMHEERKGSSDSELQEYPYNPVYDHFYENPITSAKNDSSMVLYLKFDGFSALFTGDCGIEGLEKAVQFAEDNFIDIAGVNCLQIPHHGSIKNISKKLIDDISPEMAFVSAPASSEKHPSRLLMNYLTKHKDIKVFHISKSTIRFNHKAPAREGWTSVKPLSLFQTIFWPKG